MILYITLLAQVKLYYSKYHMKKDSVKQMYKYHSKIPTTGCYRSDHTLPVVQKTHFHISFLKKSYFTGSQLFSIEGTVKLIQHDCIMLYSMTTAESHSRTCRTESFCPDIRKVPSLVVLSSQILTRAFNIKKETFPSF